MKIHFLQFMHLPVCGTYCLRLIRVEERALLGYWQNDYRITIQILWINFNLKYNPIRDVLGNIMW